MGTETNGWKQVEELVLYRLDQLAKSNEVISEAVEDLRDGFLLFKSEIVEKKASKEEVAKLQEELTALKLTYASEVSALKIQAGVWGGLAGLIPVVLTLGIAAIAWFIS